MTTNELMQEQDTGSGGAMVQVAQSRAAQEVQAMMVIAKKFPRNEDDAYAKIMRACSRVKMAEGACYSYPKGGQNVTGPSIRLAEELARSWGNVDFGIVELERIGGASKMMAYCWDLETNSRQTKIFDVKHWRDTRSGGYALTDGREIYELTANQGARRLRACILGVIPGWVVDDAVEKCEHTLTHDAKEPLKDRIAKMVAAFDSIGVTRDMLEARLGHKVGACDARKVVEYGKVYKSIADGMGSASDFFDMPETAPGEMATPPAETLDALIPDDGAKSQAKKPDPDLAKPKPNTGKIPGLD